MPSHTILETYATGDASYGTTATVTDAQARSVDETLSASTTNTEVDIVLTNAQVKSLMITSTSGDLIIKTNSTSAPTDTVTMTAGEVIIWSSPNSIGTNPFATGNVSKLYLSSTAGTTFRLRAIVTATNG